AVGYVPKQRKMKLVDVEVQNVELFGVLPHPVEHQHVIGNRVTNIVIETQRHGYARHQMGAGNGVPAREKRHLVAKSDQFVGEIGDDSLAAAVKSRRHALHERRDLRDFHIFLSTGPVPTATYFAAKSSTPHSRAKRKIGGETHPVRKFIILYGNSSFRVGDRRQKRDFRASRIESRVLNDDWHVRLEYRGIVGIARNRLRVVEIIKA